MRLRISVTQEDIDKGTSRSAYCPVALAVKRLGYKDVHVLGEIRADDFRFSVPLLAAKFIDRFDEGKPVYPFTFTATRIG